MTPEEPDFDEREHLYSVGNRVLPPVTRILAVVRGFGPGGGRGHDEYLRERGEYVHLATQYDDEGRLDEDSVRGTSTEPFLAAYRRFREESKVQIHGVEKRTWHPQHLYAGTIDRIVTLKGEKGILDIKTGEPGLVNLQLAAYLEAYNQHVGQVARAKARWSLLLREDGTYRLARYSDRADWKVFLAALTVYRYREERA